MHVLFVGQDRFTSREAYKRVLYGRRGCGLVHDVRENGIHPWGENEVWGQNRKQLFLDNQQGALYITQGTCGLLERDMLKLYDKCITIVTDFPLHRTLEPIESTFVIY